MGSDSQMSEDSLENSNLWPSSRGNSVTGACMYDLRGRIIWLGSLWTLRFKRTHVSNVGFLCRKVFVHPWMSHIYKNYYYHFFFFFAGRLVSWALVFHGTKEQPVRLRNQTSPVQPSTAKPASTTSHTTKTTATTTTTPKPTIAPEVLDLYVFNNDNNNLKIYVCGCEKRKRSFVL